ncbi:hypothetical protein Pcinc_028660 [Petrolisthes cinctipes]|uniref:Uncharacterized protein n=1 Tax=Petrolisthes cinctipes TaxID=88211 RepID=A0AAE1K902_PETCI|nr:hypothetical protein Pcinc_028660 [Petrolisthes cinctipes]
MTDAQKFQAVVRALPMKVFNIVQSRLEESAPTTYIELQDIISRALGKTKTAYMEQLDLMQADGCPPSTILRHMKVHGVCEYPDGGRQNARRRRAVTRPQQWLTSLQSTSTTDTTPAKVGTGTELPPVLQVAITTPHGDSAAGKQEGQRQTSAVSFVAFSSPVFPSTAPVPPNIHIQHVAVSTQTHQADNALQDKAEPMWQSCDPSTSTAHSTTRRSLSLPPHSSTTHLDKRSIATSPPPSCRCIYRSRPGCEHVWQVYSHFAFTKCPMAAAHRSRCISTSPPTSCRYAHRAMCPMARVHRSRRVSTSPPPSSRYARRATCPMAAHLLSLIELYLGMAASQSSH